MTPEEWYKGEKKIIDKAAQQQYEEAYVNKELMNKYLKQNLAEQGLANTGMANLYAQQANTDYMNQRANIAQAQQQSEQSLYDLYSQKKEKQFNDNSAAALESYLSQLAEAENAYGYIDDEKLSELTGGFDHNMLNSADRLKYETAYKGYVGTEEEKKAKAQDEFYTDMKYGMYENDRAGNITIDEWYRQADDAYNNGEISRDQYYEITDWIDGKAAPNKEIEQNRAMTNFTDTKLTPKINKNGQLSNEDADDLIAELDKIKDVIGEDNYIYTVNEIDKKRESALADETAKLNRQFRRQFPEVVVDASSGIDADTNDLNAFGNFASESGKQEEYVSKILRKADKGEFKNGDLIDFNYGANLGKNKEGIYMYYNGKFYKVSNKKRKDATWTHKNIG
jgi:hypothetical protein